MTTAISFMAAACASAGLWVAARNQLSHRRLCRENFRGNVIPAVAGVVVAVVSAFAALVLVFVGGDDLDAAVAFAAFQGAIGFGGLGLLDDLGAAGSGGGFGGHLRALRSGTITTGMVKLVGGGLLALLLAGFVTDGGLVGWLRDGALIALGANLANLFDRAPARTTKVALITVVALAIGSGVAASMAPAAIAVGAAVGIGWWELREQLMQGDTGANVTGALVALGAVATLGEAALWACLVVVFALNLLSERVSFSRVIAGNRVLRAIDMFGRPPVAEG